MRALGVWARWSYWGGGPVRRLSDRLAAPATQVRFNGACMAAWFVMVPVTLLVAPLRTAILYLALMSVWANFATHLGGWISALVNVRAERLDDRSGETATLAHIEAMEQRILAYIEGSTDGAQ